MGGCRLSGGGLHLGHYLGCLLPLVNFPDCCQYFFVIRDRPNHGLDRGTDFHTHDLLAVLADLMATPFADRICPVLQSNLFPFYRKLVDAFQTTLTLNQLVSVHPQKRRLHQWTSTMSVGDLMFPIESACTYFILRAEYVLMNDDNNRFVKFANRLHSKMCSDNRFASATIPAPHLCHGPLPRLHGFDLRKMSKANMNCIFLSDSDETLDKRISQLMHFKFLFRQRPDLGEEYARSPIEFHLPDEYPPFEYLRAFSSEFTNINHEDRLRTLDGQEMLREMLRTVIVNNLVRPIRERSTYLRSHENEVWAWLESSTENAVKVAARTESLVLAGSSL